MGHNHVYSRVCTRAVTVRHMFKFSCGSQTWPGREVTTWFRGACVIEGCVHTHRRHTVMCVTETCTRCMCVHGRSIPNKYPVKNTKLNFIVQPHAVLEGRGTTSRYNFHPLKFRILYFVHANSIHCTNTQHKLGLSINI